MRLFLIISVSLLATVIILWVAQLLPIPVNFMRYLWWQTTPSAVALKGSIRTGNTDIYYCSYGKGSPLLLLHGGLSRRLIWFSQVPWLVDSGRQVILLDIRGHGESDLGDSELTYRLLADDAIQVLRQLGIQRTDVIGWSDGANTALILAHDWPGHVDRIVAISANFDPSGLTHEARIDNHTRSSGLEYWLKRWWSGAGAQFFELERRIKHLWKTGPKLKPADVRAIEAPTLVIVGEQDVVTLDHARQLAKLLPRGSLAVIPGGGHATLVTRAEQVNQLIGQFLK